MQRLHTAQRPGWEETVLRSGLVYSPTPRPDGSLMSYWQEGPYYSFTVAEIDALELAAARVFAMCDEAGDEILGSPALLRRMAIPEWAVPAIRRSWNLEPARASVYGRFDVCFGGLDHPQPALRIPRFYEFNADTPTCLLEAGWAQWEWLTHTGAGRDQWNQLWERLVAAWSRNLELVSRDLGHRPVVHFTASSEDPSGEDVMNTLYLLDTCRAAGYETRTVFIEAIKLGDDGRFYDTDDQHIEVLFKLYPWEHITGDEFGRAAFASMRSGGNRTPGSGGGTVWVEPPYKMLWANKGLFAVLWEMFGTDTERSQYLLPTWFAGDEPDGLADHVRKPLLGREGGSVTVVEGGRVVEQAESHYGAEGFVVQALAEPPRFETADEPRHAVCGVWMVDGEPAGLGIRESTGVITDNQSYFVPHSIADGVPSYDCVAPPEPTTVAAQAQAQFVGRHPTPADLPRYALFGGAVADDAPTPERRKDAEP